MLKSILGEQLGSADLLQFHQIARPVLIFQVMEGLRRGLSRFMGPSRVALLFSAAENDPLLVFDPYGALDGSKKQLRDFYLDTSQWRQGSAPSATNAGSYSYPEPTLPGLIACGRQSGAVAYQMWFASSNNALCSAGPVEQWLAKASWILAHELSVGTSLFTRSATHTLESYSQYAIGDYLLQELRKILRAEPGFRPDEVLKATASISTTYEEGKLPTGALAFVSPRLLPQVAAKFRFPAGSRPLLHDYKHVRKLLTIVETTGNYLLSDGQFILGIGSQSLPESVITVRFRNGHGEMRLGDNLMCTFGEGEFCGLNRLPQWQDLERAITRRVQDDTSAGRLLAGIANLVTCAQDRGHGLTIIIDFGLTLRTISGQKLEAPLNLCESYELVEGMSRIDGALHLDKYGQLHAFACLLDGRAIAGEDRARGARYNSALRFTADYHDSLAIVVSADGPVAILESGRQINLPPNWSVRDSIYMEPPLFADWVEQPPMPPGIAPGGGSLASTFPSAPFGGLS